MRWPESESTMLCHTVVNAANRLALLALVGAFGLCSEARSGGAEIVFSNGFEAVSSALRCPDAGAAPPARYDWGPLPDQALEEIACIEVRNDLPIDRFDEVAFSAIPLPASAGLLDSELPRLAIVASGSRIVPAQFSVRSRWGGPLADTSRPVRWLEVSMQPGIGAGETRSYALVRLAQPVQRPVDPLALVRTQSAGAFEVSSGAARFRVDGESGAGLSSVRLFGPGLDQEVYAFAPGDGPFLRLPGLGSELGTAGASARLDPGSFAWWEVGPVRAVLALRGHFIQPGATRCVGPGYDYERFGYTLVLGFTRGSRDVDVEFHLRNECSQAFSADMTDEATTVDRAGLRLSLQGASGLRYAVDSSEGWQVQVGLADLSVLQEKGGGTPWTRRAVVRNSGTVKRQAESWSQPALAQVDGSGRFLAMQQAFMRYREPMGLRAEAEGRNSLSMDIVSEPLVIGEGKAIWTRGRWRFGAGDAELSAFGPQAQAAIERGLLVRASAVDFDRADLLPPIASAPISPPAQSYQTAMERLHADTVGPQWARAKTYGSQLWPDIQFDLFTAGQTFADPAANGVRYNYWNASGAEHMEWFRTGDPRWSWDFALPQNWLQLFTAYLNTGNQNPGIYEGVAVQSGGTGEGQWHRASFGSDDYSYNGGQAYGYAIRPGPASVERFSASGAMLVNRYGIPRAQQGSRDPFISSISIQRQKVQHFEMLANCAEFVPGTVGASCHARLMEILSELVQDNLSAGVLCVADVPQGTDCIVDQQFMQNALHLPFLHRVWRNYRDTLPPSVASALHRTLIEAPRQYLAYGMARGAGGSIDSNGAWWAQMRCTLDATRTQVLSCADASSTFGSEFYSQNYPHTLSWLLAAQALSPGGPGSCARLLTALDEQLPGGSDTGFVGYYVNNGSGWWKGASQVMQGLIHAPALASRCED